MSTAKPFQTIEQQINLLQNRKLIITEEDIEKTREFSIKNNYYRVSGYSLTLRHNDVFFQNSSIDTLIQIYEADRRMRHVMLSILEVVETQLKSLMAYFHAEKHGSLGYLDINNFNCLNVNKVDIRTVNDYLHITRKADQQKNISYDSELFLKYHKDYKNGVLPFWVYVEVLTISDVSKLYTILDEDIQKKIAIQLGFRSANGNEIIRNLLHCASILRNICAHGGRLYNRLNICAGPHFCC